MQLILFSVLTVSLAKAKIKPCGRCQSSGDGVGDEQDW